jgi:hypothetical protein
MLQEHLENTCGVIWNITAFLPPQPRKIQEKATFPENSHQNFGSQGCGEIGAIYLVGEKFRIEYGGPRDGAQEVEHLSSKHKALSSNLSITKREKGREGGKKEERGREGEGFSKNDD